MTTLPTNIVRQGTPSRSARGVAALRGGQPAVRRLPHAGDDFRPGGAAPAAARAGFVTAEGAAPEDLDARYFARRKDGLRMGSGVRLMCAGT